MLQLFINQPGIQGMCLHFSFVKLHNVISQLVLSILKGLQACCILYTKPGTGGKGF